MQVDFSRKLGVVLLASSVALGAVFSISSVYAQIARLELHAFQTQTPTDQEFLTGKKDAKPATISGELRIPRAGTDRLPAVVLLHGSGGLSSLQDNWAREFSTIAVATFIVDSFTGRGVTNTQNDQDQLSRWVMIGDAYRALELLAKHPRIDRARVVVMGFSRGGGAAHYSALKRFATMHGPAGSLGFAGYIGLSIRRATGSSSTAWRWQTSRSASSMARRTTTSRPRGVADMSSASGKPART
jgi:cephalosporin-C deacetylase-like acetyl esterase